MPDVPVFIVHQAVLVHLDLDCKMWYRPCWAETKMSAQLSSSRRLSSLYCRSPPGRPLACTRLPKSPSKKETKLLSTQNESIVWFGSLRNDPKSRRLMGCYKYVSRNLICNLAFGLWRNCLNAYSLSAYYNTTFSKGKHGELKPRR